MLPERLNTDTGNPIGSIPISARRKRKREGNENNPTVFEGYKPTPQEQIVDDVNVVTSTEFEKLLSQQPDNYLQARRSLQGSCTPIRDLSSGKVIYYQLWVQFPEEIWLKLTLWKDKTFKRYIEIEEDGRPEEPLVKMEFDSKGNVSREEINTRIGKIQKDKLFLLASTIRRFFAQKNPQPLNLDPEEIRDLDWEAFSGLLGAKTENFEEAWANLLQQTTLGFLKKDIIAHRANVTLPQTSPSSSRRVFNLILFKSGYESTTLIEQDIYPHGTGKSQYFFIQLQNDGFVRPVLRMRFDGKGIGELMWVQRTEPLNGTKMKELALEISKYFHTQTLYLHDDARIRVRVPPIPEKTPHTDTLNGIMNIILGLITPIASDDGSTWYSRDGFTPLQCRNVTLFGKNQTLNQEPSYYFAAVEYTRNMKLSVMQNEIFPKDSEKQDLIKKCFERYCEGKIFEETSFHDLVKAVFTKFQSVRHQNGKDFDRIKRDFAEFYPAFFHSGRKDQRAKTNPALARWNLAREIISAHFLFIKNFSPQASPSSYAEFISGEHPTFLSLVGDVPASLDWNDLLRQRVG